MIIDNERIEVFRRELGDYLDTKKDPMKSQVNMYHLLSQHMCQINPKLKKRLILPNFSFDIKLF